MPARLPAYPSSKHTVHSLRNTLSTQPERHPVHPPERRLDLSTQQTDTLSIPQRCALSTHQADTLSTHLLDTLSTHLLDTLSTHLLDTLSTHLQGTLSSHIPDKLYNVLSHSHVRQPVQCKPTRYGHPVNQPAC